ncbi:MAG: Bug family tripartite tricarboxylate transporter substrate binding protein [Burkholderiaceae bacterium]
MHHAQRRRGLKGLAGLTSLGAVPRSWAQSAWPDRPISIIVPSAAGGAADFTGRSFAQALSRALNGAAVTVDNRAGAGGIVGTIAARNAAPDGHAFLISTNSTHAANPFLYLKPGYDPQKEFDPVGLFGKFGTVLIVQAGSPHRSLPMLIEAARKAPGKLTFGYYSSSSQVPSELLKARAKIDVVGASYKNITQIVTDLIGGQLDFAFLDMLSAAPALQNQSLRPIAVSAPVREPSLPQVLTVAETLPGYAVQGWIGLHAPAGTPRTIIERVNQVIGQAMSDAAIRAAFEARGMQVATLSPEALRAFVIEDTARWKDWVTLAGIKPQ